MLPRGLASAVDITSGWVLSGGVDVGVMRQIGSGLRAAGSISPCIGFAPLKALSQDIRDSAATATTPHKVDKHTILEAHHSHFILCHDEEASKQPSGHVRRASKVSETMTTSNAHHAVRRSVEEHLQQRLKVPRLMVVVGGENDVYNEICEALNVKPLIECPVNCFTSFATSANPLPPPFRLSLITSLPAPLTLNSLSEGAPSSGCDRRTRVWVSRTSSNWDLSMMVLRDAEHARLTFPTRLPCGSGVASQVAKFMDQLRPAHKNVVGDYPVDKEDHHRFGLAITRFKVPPDLVMWKVDFPAYAPKYYIKQTILDIEARSRDAEYDDEPSFRRQRMSSVRASRLSVATEKSVKLDLPVDPEDLSKVPATDAIADRPSYEGAITFDPKGFPRNPRGRTGLRGRGSLWMWGPNHAADPIITRRNPKGTQKLQMLALRRVQKRPGNDEEITWKIPGSVIRERGDIVGYKLYSTRGSNQRLPDPAHSANLAFVSHTLEQPRPLSAALTWRRGAKFGEFAGITHTFRQEPGLSSGLRIHVVEFDTAHSCERA